MSIFRPLLNVSKGFLLLISRILDIFVEIEIMSIMCKSIKENRLFILESCIKMKNEKIKKTEINDEAYEIKKIEIKAFGHQFSLLPGLAEDLITLEKEGVIYSYFWNEVSQDFLYYKIKLLPTEIFQIVEAYIAKQKFDNAIDNGASFDEALEFINDNNIEERVFSYGDYGKTKMRDGTIEDIRGCMASFYPPEIETLLCGGKKERYELLPNLNEENKESIILKMLDSLSFITKHLEKRKHNRPAFIVENEYDVHDIIFCLIKAIFKDAREEEWTTNLAGKSKRVDIVIPCAEILLEVKYIRNDNHAKSIVDELMIDIESYYVHPKCNKLIFFIWDPKGYIIDSAIITDDLSGLRNKGDKQFFVKVIIKH